ncbi:MAG TPA: hypothetical protein VKY26_03460 [Actinomycetota bacterium]|nr:hypothetical protein [Actinomycetota bacterium]
MPLPGGPSDKAGTQAQTLRIEVPGDEGVGSEFRLRVDGGAECHQAKRQRATGPWTVNALITEGVLPKWQSNLSRGDRSVFVARTGANELREMAHKAEGGEVVGRVR